MEGAAERKRETEKGNGRREKVGRMNSRQGRREGGQVKLDHSVFSLPSTCPTVLL